MPIGRSDRIQFQLFILKILGDHLGALARTPGSTKPMMLGGALTAWLDRKGLEERKACFAQGLDRLIVLIARDGHVRIEGFASLIRGLLRVNTPFQGDGTTCVGTKLKSAP